MSDVLTVPEVAQVLRLHPDSVRSLIRRGVLKPVPLHGIRRVLVARTVLDRYLTDN